MKVGCGQENGLCFTITEISYLVVDIFYYLMQLSSKPRL